MISLDSEAIREVEVIYLTSPLPALCPAINQLFVERDTPKGANIVMELWATLEELFVGNFVEVGIHFQTYFCLIDWCFLSR